MNTYFARLRAMLRSGSLVTLAAAALAACSGGSDDSAAPTSPPATSDTGTLLISLTDADGDFVSYSVDVLSVTLQRFGGGTVEVLPAKTRIDFAQLTELSDLLAVATLAPGDIVGGKIRLDYGSAEVFVESGGQVVQANIVGPNGAPLGVTELDIQLPARERLVITRGRAAVLALDFDLAASHDVRRGTRDARQQPGHAGPRETRAVAARHGRSASSATMTHRSRTPRRRWARTTSWCCLRTRRSCSSIAAPCPSAR